MNAKEITASWKWRIHKVGVKIYEFAAMVNMPYQQLSGYMAGRKSPNISTFDRIESKLRELEAKDVQN